MSDGDAETLAAIRARAAAAFASPWGSADHARFMTAAREDVPWLLARVEQLEAENAELRKTAGERAAWLLGERCNCGYGGCHEPEDPRCRINQVAAELAGGVGK